MSRIGGTTRIAGIIGWPVSASLSPAIHNAAFAAAGLDWAYVAFPVRPERIADSVSGMRALGIAGLNVTMPHKRAVIPYLDALSDEAAALGAVNTISADGDRLTGANTDGGGFLRFLEAGAGLPPKGVRALVLGGGGAARAVSAALAFAGAEVSVAARRSEQAGELIAVAAGARLVRWESRSEAASAAELVVNATPVGRDGEESPIDARALKPGHVVVDLTYHPRSTPLLGDARAAGAAAFNGLGMLLHQAALSFEMWTKRPAPLEAMQSAIDGAR